MEVRIELGERRVRTQANADRSPGLRLVPGPELRVDADAGPDSETLRVASVQADLDASAASGGDTASDRASWKSLAWGVVGFAIASLILGLRL